MKVKDIEASEKFLNILGYERYLRMIDTNYMYENGRYTVYIQDIKELEVFFIDYIFEHNLFNVVIEFAVYPVYYMATFYIREEKNEKRFTKFFRK